MVLILILPTLLLVYYYYRTTVPDIPKNHKTLLFFLRFIVIAILLLLLFNPIIVLKKRVTYYPEIVFLIDNSLSMDLKAGGEKKSEIMKRHGDILKKEAEKMRYKLRNFNFADGIDGEKTSTNLSQTLQNLSERTNIADVKKIFLLSDGWFQDEQLDIIERLNTPIVTIHPEYASDDFDLAINRLIYNQTAYTEEEVTIFADVSAEDFEEQAELKLFIDDKLADKQNIDFSKTYHQKIAFNHTFTNHGLFTIRVDIEPQRQGEVNKGNNSFPGAIRVQEKRSGTYIICDKLLWDTKYLNSALRRDDRKDVAVFIQKNYNFFKDNERIEIEELFPNHLQMLVIINYGGLYFLPNQIQIIEKYVANGGGLLSIGKPLSGLENIIAASDSGINRLFKSTISFTSESSKYQTFNNIKASEIPPVEHYYVASMLHPQILARFDNDDKSPAIIYNEYKSGRVIYFPFFNLWRWQMRGEGDQYNIFVDNLSSWLSNPAGIDFFAQPDKNSYFLGEDVTISLTALDETLNTYTGLNPKLSLYREEVERKGEKKEHKPIKEEYLLYENQRYAVNLSQLHAGKYSFDIKEEGIGRETNGEFIVSDLDVESHNRGFSYPLLAYISRQTGGEILYDEDVENYSFEQAKKETKTVHYDIPLYKHWLVILLFLLSFCTELFFRKLWGLL